MTNGTGTKSRYIIVDTDMGSDDAFALQMLLKAEKSLKNIKILAITTVHGNTTLDNVLKNTYHLLNGFDRTDVKYQNNFNLVTIRELTFKFLHVLLLIDSDLSRFNRKSDSRRNENWWFSR